MDVEGIITGDYLEARTKMKHISDLEKLNKETTHNSTDLKVAVQWLNQPLYIYQSLCLANHKMLKNCYIRITANRYT